MALLSPTGLLVAWGSLLFASSVSLVADPSATQQQQAAALSHRASDLIDAGNLSQAESTLRQSLALMPAQPTRLYNLACVLAGEKKIGDAMTALEQATDAGFTDFTILSQNRTLVPLHDLPRYLDLLTHKDQIVHHAAELAVASLRRDLGEQYLYDVDDSTSWSSRWHWISRRWKCSRAICSRSSRRRRARYSHIRQTSSFGLSFPPRLTFRGSRLSPHLGGEYDDTTRTAVSMRLGQFMTHEFTHATACRRPARAGAGTSRLAQRRARVAVQKCADRRHTAHCA